MSKLSFNKILFTLITFLFLAISVNINGVYATTSECNISAIVYEGIQDDYGVGLRRTGSNFVVTASMDTMCRLISGTSCDKMTACGPISKEKLSPELRAESDFLPDNCSDIEVDEEICQALSTSSLGIFESDFANRDNRPLGKGGMISLANYLEAVSAEPPPLNLAYFVDKTLEPVPFYQPAYADDPKYEAPFVDDVLNLWTVTRNIAIIFMSTIFIIVGIMIMLRKEVSPRVAVTLQYAIPRLVIAFGLIFFSYPIGATLATLAWQLGASGPTIVNEMLAGFGGVGSLGWEDFGLFDVLVAGLLLLLFNGVGLFLVLLIIAAYAIAFLVFIWLQVVKLMVLLKMIIATISGPIEIAFGAIPGNESVVIDWFKRQGVYVVALFAIGIGQEFTMALAGYSVFGGADPGYVGGFAGIFAVPVILIYGFSQCGQIPKKLEQRFLGKR